MGVLQCILFVRVVQTALLHATAVQSLGGNILHHVRQLRNLQLALNLFNLSASGMVFAHKLICLIGSIIGLYFLVRLAPKQPEAALVFFPFAADGISYWMSQWDNASLIPRMISDLKLRLQFCHGRHERVTEQVVKILKSVAPVGVSVGGFRSLERESTPIFMHFVVTNVAVLLLTF